MLAADRRVTDSDTFRRIVRAGRRAGSPALVVHVIHQQPEPPGGPSEARVGFVVNRSVGNAVTRNRVKRRLRHLVHRNLSLLPPGLDLVVRAQPPAAGLTSAELEHQLLGCLDRGIPENKL